jgi:branched-chain amino acid transport system substrate-binding protein
MSKKFLFLLLVIVLVVLGTGIFSWQKLMRKEPQVVKIGVIAPLSGEVAQYGAEVRNGVQLAVSQLNKEQKKYRYEVISFDDEADPDIAKKRAEEMVLNQEILAVIGPAFSVTTLSAGEVFQNGKLPAISPSATSPKVTELGDFIFRVCPSDAYNGKALANFVIQDLGYHKIAILWDETHAAYSGELANAFIKRAEQLGAVITKHLAYQFGQTDFTPLLQEVKETEPEVLVLTGYATEAALIAQQTRLLGWEIPIVGGDGLHVNELIEKGGKAVEGVKFTSFFSADDPRPQVQEFVSAYRERYGVDPGWAAAHSYDAMRIIASAIEKEGPTRKGIQKALSETKNFQGVTGVIGFDENGDVIKDVVKIEVRNGKFKVLFR